MSSEMWAGGVTVLVWRGLWPVGQEHINLLVGVRQGLLLVDIALAAEPTDSVGFDDVQDGLDVSCL